MNRIKKFALLFIVIASFAAAKDNYSNYYNRNYDHGKYAKNYDWNDHKYYGKSHSWNKYDLHHNKYDVKHNKYDVVHHKKYDIQHNKYNVVHHKKTL